MKRLIGILGAAAVIGLAAWGGGTPASAADMARVRVVHASPDAPAVDVYADGAKVLSAVPFKGSSDYLSVPAGAHKIEVYAAGANAATASAVITADVTLGASKDYTVIAVGRLAEIKPVVLEDNNAAPAAGKAHVRVVHASPDAPAVDIAVKGGPILFSNLAFPNAAGPAPVDAGAYDLEVRAAGTMTVALPVNGVQLQAGKIYTLLAVGLLNGMPALEALPIVNDPAPAMPAPASTPPAQAPATLPASGTGPSSTGNGALALIALAGLAMMGAGTLAVARSRSR